MRDTFQQITTVDDGQTMAEYSLVIAVIVIGVVAAVGFFGLAVSGHFTSFTNAIKLID